MSSHHLQASVALALAIGVASTATAPALAQGLPQHMVAYMARSGQKECPDNWTEAAYAQGRVILGTTDGSKIQKVAGTPAKFNKVPQHSHAFTVHSTLFDSKALPTSPAGSTPKVASGPGGDWDVSKGTTAASPTDPTGGPLPFVQFLVCERMAAESPDSAPYGTVAFFNASTCPANWAALDQADGRFLLAAFPDSDLDSSSSISWDPDGPAGHTHQLAAVLIPQSADSSRLELARADVAGGGEPAVTGTSAVAGPVLPFVSLLVCERTTGVGNSEGVPLGTVAFFGSKDCPDDWGGTIGAPGRFFIGMGGEPHAKQGATLGGETRQPGGGEPISIQHVHYFSGKIQLGGAGAPASADPDVLKGAPPSVDDYASVGGDYVYGRDSASAISEVPYFVLNACTYTAGQDWQGAGRPGRQ